MVGVLKLNYSATYGDGNGLGSICSPELFHNVPDVHFDSLLGDEELFCDVTVPVSASNLFENLYFASSESLVAIVLGQMRGDLRRDALFPRMHLPNDFHEFLWRHAFEHIGPSPGFERSGHSATLLPGGRILVVGGESNEDHPLPGRPGAELFAPPTPR